MKHLKVLVTGADGQLGRDMVQRLKKNGEKVFAFGRKELDITDIDRVLIKMKEIHPDIVIHCAAYTNVNFAEKEPNQAFLINSYGTRNVATASEQIRAKLVYVSTDYVFDGSASSPYTEFDQTNPLNQYGKSKLAGEQFVRELHSKFYIVRTSWLYGKHGHNFVKTMLTLATEKDSLSVISDQIGCPTYTVDLSERIGQLIHTDKYGIYHISNAGSCSWYEFADLIFKKKKIIVNLKKILSDSFENDTPRPSYSVLSDRALILNGFDKMRHWKDALMEFLSELKIR
ncbi:dTDP-4-dehydrorhamnose reductase [Chengkuizengella sediminis]|uniref:dTDP-4-dehydrorhamnose reductase n=1 Tax=Chengkuizengella sediminis TaxID=1885917 RepID=UPI001389BDA1|nr:dTDP-4-dehydrorhamnose reductase [Chengkuizengella sediminis]NDI36226.1 dTDP-4-dehydrorhamnose reductase [Chengkuizengella sediminis]